MEVSGSGIELNDVPLGSAFTWSEHVIKATFQSGQLLEFTVNPEKLGLSWDADTIYWRIDGRNYQGVKVVVEFQAAGNYFATVEVWNDTKKIFEEEFMFVIGNKPAAPQMLINGKEANEESTYNISRDAELVFNVKEPETGFEYLWDLGDATIRNGIEVRKKFLSEKMPLYVILKKQVPGTTLATETYTRIDSSEEAVFKVVMPPVAFTGTGNYQNFNTGRELIFILATTVVSAAFILYKKRRK